MDFMECVVSIDFLDCKVSMDLMNCMDIEGRAWEKYVGWD